MNKYNQKKYNKIFQLPRKSSEYFPSFFEKHLDEYIKYLSEFEDELSLGKDTLNEVEAMCQYLTSCLNSYYEGKIKTAYSFFTKAVDKFDAQLLLHFRKKKLTEDETVDLFRIRKVDNDEVVDKCGIFHLPMDKRIFCGSSRFGISGFPCLYLGTNVSLCLKEINARLEPKSTRETEYKNIYASKFKFNPHSSNNISVIDLTMSWAEIIERGRDNCRYFFLYPVMFACTIRRARDGGSFIPEYIFPQMLLQHLVIEGGKRSEIIGIRYLPCYSDTTLKLIGDQYNYVFPIDSETAKQEDGYSQILEDGFNWSIPSQINEFDSLSQLEDNLLVEHD